MAEPLPPVQIDGDGESLNGMRETELRIALRSTARWVQALRGLSLPL